MLQISRATSRRILFSTTLMTAFMCGQAFAQTIATNQQPSAQTPPSADTTDVDAGKTQVIIVRAERARAAARAAFKASLDQGQPQSIISRPFIELATPETGDYTNIAAITPSASSAGAPNGSGFGEAKLTIRGFSDAQYNVTFDGIPWGDTNGPSHHSNSFFPASTIGAIIVERGPGRAGDLGQVSYGGNVKMFSNKVAGEAGLTLRQTFGSWNSWQSVAANRHPRKPWWYQRLRQYPSKQIGWPTNFFGYAQHKCDREVPLSPRRSVEPDDICHLQSQQVASVG
jgi:iron complex outermembrane recepter protein